MYLHGIGSDECPITNRDALAKELSDGDYALLYFW
jgi:hypothetical protein